MFFYQIFMVIFIIGIVKGISLWSYFFKVKSMVRELGNGVTEEQVQNFIKLVRKMKMLNFPDLWNTLRAGFTLVNNAENISYENKKELMNALLSKGVNLGNVKIHKGNETTNAK
ncbi:MAG: hypothetical protein PWQ70_796 [Clostridiales bacterium]|nr:hypothetical protein [Clostridiales bacterium]